MKSSFVLISTVVALAVAALALTVWGTRPEPTLMLFIGAELAIVGSAARSRDRRNNSAPVRSWGVTKS